MNYFKALFSIDRLMIHRYIAGYSFALFKNYKMISLTFKGLLENKTVFDEIHNIQVKYNQTSRN